jgi:transposase-like protein
MLTIAKLIDDAKCYEVVRNLRWPEGVHCPSCNSTNIEKRGHHDRYSYRQRYACRACQQQFDD